MRTVKNKKHFVDPVIRLALAQVAAEPTAINSSLAQWMDNTFGDVSHE